MKRGISMCVIVLSICGCQQQPGKAPRLDQSQERAGALTTDPGSSAFLPSAAEEKSAQPITMGAFEDTGGGNKETGLLEPRGELQQLSGGQDIIAQGRWFFSVHNTKEGYTDYYESEGGFLGREVAD